MKKLTSILTIFITVLIFTLLFSCTADAQAPLLKPVQDSVSKDVDGVPIQIYQVTKKTSMVTIGNYFTDLRSIALTEKQIEKICKSIPENRGYDLIFIIRLKKRIGFLRIPNTKGMNDIKDIITGDEVTTARVITLRRE